MSSKTKVTVKETEGFKALAKSIEEVSHEAYYKNSPHQITIDLIERSEELINNMESYKDDSILDKDTVGSNLYQIGLVLEVINPELANDFEYLTQLQLAFMIWEVFYKEYLKD